MLAYSLPGKTGEPVRDRLVTTLLDHQRAPATEFASLYHERGEIEGLFDERTTHLHQSRRVLRSNTAEDVRQEFYGWVLAHDAICWLMHRAADTHGVTPRSVSCTGNVRLVRRTQPLSGAFPPRAVAGATQMVR